LAAKPSRAIYGTPKFVEDHPSARIEDRYLDCKWVGYDDSHHALASASWLEAKCAGRKPQLRCTSSLVLLEAVKASAGLAMLPCYIGDHDRDLVRVSSTIDSLQTRIWLVYHADSRNRPAVMALVNSLDDLFARHGRLSVDHPDP